MLALRMKLIFLITTKNNVSLYFIHSFVTCHFCIFTMSHQQRIEHKRLEELLGIQSTACFFFFKRWYSSSLIWHAIFPSEWRKWICMSCYKYDFIQCVFTFYPNIMTNNQIEFLWCDEWIFEQIKHFDLSLYSLLNLSL